MKEKKNENAPIHEGKTGSYGAQLAGGLRACWRMRPSDVNVMRFRKKLREMGMFTRKQFWNKCSSTKRRNDGGMLIFVPNVNNFGVGFHRTHHSSTNLSMSSAISGTGTAGKRATMGGPRCGAGCGGSERRLFRVGQKKRAKKSPLWSLLIAHEFEVSLSNKKTSSKQVGIDSRNRALSGAPERNDRNCKQM